MRANELMLGDWVESRGKIEQVREVYDGYICTDSFEDSHDYYFDPIPLTTEILEKNGFKARWYEELVLEADEYCFALQKGVDGINAWWWETFSSPIIPINCVHQLQHALRLCGIDKTIVL